MRRAVFPGSFDPITLGHIDIIDRALPLFDEIIVAIGVNAEKKTMWDLEQRTKYIEEALGSYEKVRIMTYNGLTAQFCLEQQAHYILRGLRNTLDFSYERSIAQTNARLSGVESIFIISSPGTSHISSTIVRDIARHGGDYSQLVPFKI